MSSALDDLGDLEGWRVEGDAARVHYSGDGDRYSVEFYAANDTVVYWNVPTENDRDTAVPVRRESVPTPLRERIRHDLDAAGVDPAVERRPL